MLCALIMAGGKGERFWPMSTEEKPKQFLNLLGEGTMIQMTVNRLENLIPIEKIFVVTAKRYVNLVKEQLPMLPEKNIIIEPVGKNTAPCIGLSAFIIDKYYKDATIAVLPSDHLIVNEEKFRMTIEAANSFIKKENDVIVTLGMKPNRPDTGYGYIKYDLTQRNLGEFKINKVDKFVEKPNLDKALEYLRQGNYLWNGGMFIWKTSTILKLTEKYLSNTYAVLREIAITKEEDFNNVLEEKYKLVEGISVDYGIMENADNIYVIPSDFGWDDVGNWTSIERHREKDVNNNVKNSKCTYYNSSNNIAITNKKILFNHVSDLIVVETEEYILISSKRNEQDIKEAKKMIL